MVVKDFALTVEKNSALKTEVEMTQQPLTGGTSRLEEQFTFVGDQSIYNSNLILYRFFLTLLNWFCSFLY